MLGWEFPPFISGGLGTACYGLTRALDARGHEITFVLPKPVDRSHASHVRLVSPASSGGPTGDGTALPDPGPGSGGEAGTIVEGDAGRPDAEEREGGAGVFERMRFVGVPASMPGVYGDFSEEAEGSVETAQGLGLRGGATASERRAVAAALEAAGVSPAAAGLTGGSLTHEGQDYSGDMAMAAARYAALVLTRCGGERFDVIHAHDWMTYPAGLAIARSDGQAAGRAHPLDGVRPLGRARQRGGLRHRAAGDARRDAGDRREPPDRGRSV